MAKDSELADFGPQRLQVGVIEGHLLDLLLAADGHGAVQPITGGVKLPQLAGVTGQVEGDGQLFGELVKGRQKGFPGFLDTPIGDTAQGISLVQPAGGALGGAAQEGPEPGSDLEYQVNVPFWTAIRGGVMRLNITRHDSCPHCHGHGFIESAGTCPECGGKGQVTQTGGRMKFNVPCPRCHGTGKNISVCPECHGEGSVERTEPLEVRIKAGTRDGQRIRIAGKGNAGLRGGPTGDLYVIIRTAEHPVFQREGDDIRITVPVSATEAALGAKIEVPTIDGRTLLKIPPGTQSGQKLRLREKGVPSATKEGARGDEIVEVKVTVPMPKDERSKEILRELAKLNPEDPRADLWKNV